MVCLANFCHEIKFKVVKWGFQRLLNSFIYVIQGNICGHFCTVLRTIKCKIKFTGKKICRFLWHRDSMFKNISSKMVNFRSNFLHVPQHKSMRFFSFPHQENMGKVSERIRFDGTQLLECPWHRDSRLKIFLQKWSISGPIFSMFPNINLFVF